MKNKGIIISCIAIIMVLIIALFFKKGTAAKLGYIKNNELYESFTLKKELAEKLTTVENKRKAILDSLIIPLRMLSMELQKNKDEKLMIQFRAQQESYLAKKKEFEEDNKRLMQEYSDQIWKQINQYIADYGKEKGYGFIYGATGDGAIMFAEDQYDLTSELSSYINEKYNGKK
jgi:outer membrane protein